MKYRKSSLIGTVALAIALSGCGETKENSLSETSFSAETIIIQSTTNAANTEPITENQTAVSQEPQASSLSQKIPVIRISTLNNEEITSRETYISCDFSVDYTDDCGYDDINNASAQIRGRGNSTWKWDKKPYKKKLDKKASLCGLEAARDWVLLANYADPSLIRNNVVMDSARVLDKIPFVPTMCSADLYLNDEYAGVYCLCEQIEFKSGRIEAAENDSADTSFLLEIGGVDKGKGYVKGTDYFTTKHTNSILLQEPRAASAEQFAFIEDYVLQAEGALYSGEGWTDYIDVESFVDWFIATELFYNLDGAGNRSFYILKEAGGKLKAATIWDFDLALGNYSVDPETYNQWACGFDAEFHDADNWAAQLLTQEEFVSALKKRWQEVKEPILNAALDSVEKNSALLMESQEKNFEVWDIMGQKAGYQKWSVAALSTYEQHVDYLTEFITARYEWIDRQIS